MYSEEITEQQMNERQEFLDYLNKLDRKDLSMMNDSGKQRFFSEEVDKLSIVIRDFPYRVDFDLYPAVLTIDVKIMCKDRPYLSAFDIISLVKILRTCRSLKDIQYGKYMNETKHLILGLDAY